MFYQPDYIVYLWVLPVIGLILFPILGSFMGMLYSLIERSLLTDVRGFLDISSSPQEKPAHDKRKQIRTNIIGPKAKIALRMKCCRTDVVNVSPDGICLENLPRKMLTKSDRPFNVVFRTREQDFSLLVKPRWQRQVKNRYTVGAEIIQKPRGWKYFIHDLCKPLTAEPV